MDIWYFYNRVIMKKCSQELQLDIHWFLIKSMELAISDFTLCYIIATKFKILTRVDRRIGFMLIRSSQAWLIFI